MKLITKLFIVIDIIVILCFLFVYGPIEYAKIFWITTAMGTGSHHYLAYIFYSEDTVSEVMNKNSLQEITEETDISTIKIGEKKTTYDSVYEKEILEHDENDVYKLIEFKYGDFDCYLIAIYEPKRIQAVHSGKIGRGKILSDISKDNDAILAINGGGYSWSTGQPLGLIVHNGEILSAENYNSHMTGAFNEDGVLIVGKLSASEVKDKKIKEALSFAPALIVNGKPAEIKGNGGSGMNPRTVIAQRQDGIVLFLVVNGYGQKLSWKGRGGVYYRDLIAILQRYNAYNAINMDGGSSTTLVINHKLINSPCEPQKEGQDFIRSAWILK